MRDLSKRLFDIFFSILALITVSPLLLAVSLWIKLDSPGPVLFTQYRAGLGGQRFRIFKFRSMVARAPDEIDQNNEKVVSEGHDPRITRVGRFIRATSLDEIPQLLNILKGDMSVVGPRPVLMEQKVVVPPSYMIRFSLRPGLTGLSQVSGRRSLDWLDQLACDAEYVRNRSFFFDLGIVLSTVKVVVLHSDVYGGEGLNWRAYRDSLQGQPPSDGDILSAITDKDLSGSKARERRS